MRRLLWLIIALVGLIDRAYSQWDLPSPVIMVGTEEAERQVTGLAAPVSLDAAISAEAIRNQAVGYSSVVGPIWQVELQPAPASYSTGMIICVVPELPNEVGVQVDVNGLGTRPIVKVNGAPLDTAELRSGVPVRLIYDGEQFRVLGTTYRPCVQGFSPTSRTLCIEDSTRTGLNFFDAVNECTTRNARLCTYAEWIQGCNKLPGLVGTITGPEWVDNAANNISDAKTVGFGGDGVSGTVLGIGCDRGSTTVPTEIRRYRCCKHR